MLHGVSVHPLRQIPDERGKVMRMLRRDGPFSKDIPYDWALEHG